MRSSRAAVSDQAHRRDAAEARSFRVRNFPAAVGTFDAAPKAMSEVLVDYENTVAGADGSRWAARACGRKGPGNMWEGWIEFVPLDLDRKPIRSTRETTQPSREDLLYWATGLTPVYLRGALTRALEAPLTRPAPRRVRPHFEGPAPSIAAPARPSRVHPILDPFDVYEQGEGILIGQLDALDTPRLRDIVRAFELMTAEQAASASRLDLAGAIVTAARANATRARATASLPTSGSAASRRP